MRSRNADIFSVAFGALGGVAIGCGIGFLVSRRRFEIRHFREIDELKRHYKQQLAKAEKSRIVYVSSDEAEAVKAYALAHDNAQNPGQLESIRLATEMDETSGSDERAESEWPGVYSGPEEGLVDDESADPDGDAGSTDDVPWPPVDRDTEKPYVISDLEFEDYPGPNWQKLSVIWYNGDQVLGDDRNNPIRDVDVIRLVGPVSPLGFGGPAGQAYIRYVRNERLEIDFEIAFNAGSYVDEVLNYGNPNRKT